MIYRNYQRECADVTMQALAKHRSVLDVLPTGAGKSIVLKLLFEELLATYKPILLIVHRKELVGQLSETIRSIEGSRVVVERGDQTGLQDAENFDVAVCSIQTLQSRPEVLASHNFGLVAIDETHRVMADGYQDILSRVGVFSEGGPDLIGFTATNYRTDGQPLSRVYQTVGYERDLVWGIGERWLVPLKAKRVGKKQLRDGKLETVVLSDEERIEEAWSAFEEHCMEDGEVTRPTIIMAGSVEEGQKTAAYFQKHGVEAGHADSKMDQDLRDEYVQRFKDQDLPVLIGYNVLIEGFDAPHASCLLWMRRTQSPVTFMQGLGRVTRPYFEDEELFAQFNASSSKEERAELIAESAKPGALFIDLADTASGYNAVTIGDVFGLAQTFDFEGEDVCDVAGQMEALAEAYSIISTDAIESVTDLGRCTEETELWRKAVMPNVGVPENAQLTYVKIKGTFLCHLTAPNADGEDITWTVRIRQDARGAWTAELGQPEVWKEWYYNGRAKEYRLKYYKGEGKPPKGKTVTIFEDGMRKTKPRYVQVSGMPYQEIAASEEKTDIFFQAETYIYENFGSKTWKLAHKDASWREGEPTRKQMKHIKKMRKDNIAIPDDLNKGIASVLMDNYFQGLLKPMRYKR